MRDAPLPALSPPAPAPYLDAQHGQAAGPGDGDVILQGPAEGGEAALGRRGDVGGVPQASLQGAQRETEGWGGWDGSGALWWGRVSSGFGGVPRCRTTVQQCLRCCPHFSARGRGCCSP